MFKNKKGSLSRLVITAVLGAALIAGNGLAATGLLAASLRPDAAPYALADTNAAPADVVITGGDRAQSGQERVATTSAESEAWSALFETMQEEFGPIGDWSLEHYAEFSRRIAELGLPNNGIVYGVPTADDITQEEAIKIFTDTLVADYGLTKETLAKFDPYMQAFNVIDPDNPEWRLSLNPKDTADYADIGAYFCIVNARTGEILELKTAADAVG